jgi:hypothetical protein
MTSKLLIYVVLLLAVLQTVWFGVNAPVFAESVDTAWVRIYNGLGNSDDHANAMAVDNLGNVYVTGGSFGSGTYNDYATIKYYPNGDTAWVRRYNGPVDGSDYASAIAIDDSGYVYVTGSSYGGTGTYYDYATIKYYPNGDTAWVRRYNGPGDSIDVASAIAIDDSGSVYVCGMSYGNGTAFDYATIKYYPNGDTTWVRRYNGPANGFDDAVSIAVDNSGNVYVAGPSVGLNTSDDYSIVKYYPHGDTAWVRRYDGGGMDNPDDATALALDGSANIYVTGLSNGTTEYDYATIKYYPNGETVWVRKYDGPGNSRDWALAIAVDDSHNVYVTGYSTGSGTGYDYATIKYYPNGDTDWVRRYNGPGNGTDLALPIVVDDFHNVYVTGYSMGSGTGYDYATIKYYPNGGIAWVRRYNGPENSDDYAGAITVDNSGNVYVTGGSSGNGANMDYATIKYVQFLCGDVNKDGVVNSADVSYLINYLFINGPAPVPILHVGDVNVDEVVNSADVAYLINYLFISGPAPCQ